MLLERQIVSLRESFFSFLDVKWRSKVVNKGKARVSLGAVAHKLLLQVVSELPRRDGISDFVSEVEDV